MERDIQPPPLRLLCVLAHPDDESLAAGGALARYAAEGVGTFLLTATRGERGWQGPPAADPVPAALGRAREAELRAAAAVLGLRDVQVLGYGDGELARADWDEATALVASYIRHVRPQVVVTFGPDGLTGHPDHIAIGQITAAAIVCAADPSYAAPGGEPHHRAAKLYYLAESREQVAAYAELWGDSAMTVGGEARRVAGWERWAISARVDAADYAPQVWRAVACHRSQLPAALPRLGEAEHRRLWGVQEFYRAFGPPGAGPAAEDDLFAGLRPARAAAHAEALP